MSLFIIKIIICYNEINKLYVVEYQQDLDIDFMSKFRYNMCIKVTLEHHMNTGQMIQRAWSKRDQSKSDEENISRIANAFSVSEEYVQELVGNK